MLCILRNVFKTQGKLIVSLFVQKRKKYKNELTKNFYF